MACLAPLLAFSEHKPTGFILTEPQIVATHEAGHAIGYLYYGLRHGGIRLSRDADGDVVGSVVSPAGKYECHVRAVCCLAGPIGEALLTGVGIFAQPASQRDLAMAREALARIPDAPDLDLVLPFARSLVRRQWSAICTIADALLRAGHLTDEQTRYLARGMVT